LADTSLGAAERRHSARRIVALFDRQSQKNVLKLRGFFCLVGGIDLSLVFTVTGISLLPLYPAAAGELYLYT
jgi:hypothetical protein